MRSDRPQSWNRRLALALLVGVRAAILSAPAQEPAPIDLSQLTNEVKVPLWNYSADLRGLIGYKDNIFLSHTNRQSSPFWDAGGDAIVFRLPSGNWTLNGLASGDYVRYFGARTTSEEETAIAAVQASGQLGPHWTSTLAANYAYEDQLMDLSAIEPTQAGAGRVVGDTISSRWSARGKYDWAWGELEMDATRQLLESPLDSYWQLGPKVTLGAHAGPRDDLSLSYQWARLAYDHEPDLDTHGNTIPNTHLALVTHIVQLAWDRAWDQERHWHSTLTAGFEIDQDNGSSFFDRTGYFLTPKLEYRAGAWKLSASVTAAAYFYPVQTVPLSGGPHRDKTWFSAHVRAEWKVSKIVKLLANYGFDDSFSNLDIDDYHTHTISIGTELDF